MTLPRNSGFRPITVDGDAYLWRPRRVSDGANHVLIAQIASNPGAVLIADLGRPYCDVWLIFGDPPPHPGPYPPITPREVTDCIQAALAAGWRPHIPGKPFHWENTDADCHRSSPTPTALPEQG